MTDFNWCSPAHVYRTHGDERNSGIKARPIDTHVSSKLTDRKIHRYALEGRYGFEAYHAAVEEDKKKKKKKPHHEPIFRNDNAPEVQPPDKGEAGDLGGDSSQGN